MPRYKSGPISSVRQPVGKVPSGISSTNAGKGSIPANGIPGHQVVLSVPKPTKK